MGQTGWTIRPLGLSVSQGRWALPAAGSPGIQTLVTPMTREYFGLGLSITCSLGCACRAKGSLPGCPLMKTKDGGTGKSCPFCAPVCVALFPTWM